MATSGAWKGARSLPLGEVMCLAGPAVAVAEVLASTSSCHQPLAIVPLLFPVCPSRVNAKPLFFLLQGLPGGTLGLMGCVKGAPVPSTQSHLSEPGGGKGESYCTNRHSRLIAFHLWSRSWPFSPGIQWGPVLIVSVQGLCTAKGCLAGQGWSFLGKTNRATKCFVLLRLETVTVLMEVITTCLQPQTRCLHYIISLPLGICFVSRFHTKLLLVMVCHCLLCPDLADKSLFDRVINVSEISLPALVPFLWIMQHSVFPLKLEEWQVNSYMKISTFIEKKKKKKKQLKIAQRHKPKKADIKKIKYRRTIEF